MSVPQHPTPSDDHDWLAIRNIVREMIPIPDEVTTEDDNGKVIHLDYDTRKADNEATTLYYEQLITARNKKQVLQGAIDFSIKIDPYIAPNFRELYEKELAALQQQLDSLKAQRSAE